MFWHLIPILSGIEVGIRAKSRKIYENGDEYQLREGQTVYGDWRDSEYKNTFAWKLVN